MIWRSRDGARRRVCDDGSVEQGQLLAVGTGRSNIGSSILRVGDVDIGSAVQLEHC